MAVFDRGDNNKVTLDDTHPLSCVIEASENVQGHTAYILKVKRSPVSETTWQVVRRYSDFDALNSLLACSGLELPLPPKRVFGKLEREFVAERQQGLQAYIDFVLSHPLLSSTTYIKRFFDPDSYSFNFSESALQHVSMIFRSEVQWEIVETLHEFGWRIRKQYFLLKSKSDPKCHFLLAWTNFGPDRYLSDKDSCSVIKLLFGLKHPFIYPSSFSSVSDKGGLVIYNFLENGSLRDMLYKVKPKNSFLKKYGKPKVCTPLPLDKIKLFGRQILLALKFLHERGLYHGHLHTGNIIVTNNVCKLLESESFILGVPSMLRPFFVQLRKVQTVEDIDVYCFGHVIYEMAVGHPLQQSSCDTFPPSLSAELRSVLQAILTTEACKKGLPSASDLLLHPFFSNLGPVGEEKVHFKIPSQLKENLKRAKEQLEHRLREEQKMIRRSQRMSKVQTQLSSEEDRKRRSEKKKQQRMALNIPNSQNGRLSESPTPTESSVENTPILNSPPAPPPPPPPPPLPASPLLPPPPPPPPSGSNFGSQNPGNDRSALLSSIQGFNKNKLKKSETKDCSTPRV